MRRRELLAAALFLAAPALGAGEKDGRAVSRRILRLATGAVEVVPLEDYVAAVLPGEIGDAPPAALEAQAIAVRSYAIARTDRHEREGADLCDGVHCQVYRGKRAATAASRRAAEATRGLVLAMGGRVIAAPFHAACGGRTARPAEVWDDEETPDLPSVVDDACQGSAGAAWTYRMPRGDVATLGTALGLDEARFFEVYGRTSDDRVSMVRFVAPGGKTLVVRGFEFRREASKLWGAAAIRSTAFHVEENRAEYVFSGHGTGHGAGLCQRGAIARARRGETRDQILALYYGGARVVSLETLR